MKNFARKSFVAALLVLPMLSQATTYANCGAGTINGYVVKADGNVVIDVNFSPNYPSSQTWESTFLFTALSSDQASGLRSTLAAAYHSGSFVKFYGSLDCLHIAAVGVCASESSCRITNYSSWF